MTPRPVDSRYISTGHVQDGGMDLALQVPAAAGHEVDGAVAVLVGA